MHNVRKQVRGVRELYLFIIPLRLERRESRIEREMADPLTIILLILLVDDFFSFCVFGSGENPFFAVEIVGLFVRCVCHADPNVPNHE